MASQAGVELWMDALGHETGIKKKVVSFLEMVMDRGDAHLSERPPGCSLCMDCDLAKPPSPFSPPRGLGFPLALLSPAVHSFSRKSPHSSQTYRDPR